MFANLMLLHWVYAKLLSFLMRRCVGGIYFIMNFYARFLRFYKIRAECCLDVRKRVRKRTFLPGKVKTRFQAIVPLREQIKNMSDII